MISDVAPAIFELLRTNTVVRAHCAERIYPQQRAQGQQGPCVVFELIYNQPQDTADGPSDLDVMQYQIKAISSDRDVMQKIRQSIRYTLERLSDTVAGVTIQSVRLIDQGEDQDNDSKEYYSLDDYSFRIQRNNLLDESISPYQYRQRVTQAGGEVVGFNQLTETLTQ